MFIFWSKEQKGNLTNKKETTTLTLRTFFFLRVCMCMRERQREEGDWELLREKFLQPH
jgi:hypothetical protein